MAKMILSPAVSLRENLEQILKRQELYTKNVGVNKISSKYSSNLETRTKMLTKLKFIKQIGGDDVIHWTKEIERFFKFAYMQEVGED